MTPSRITVTFDELNRRRGEALKDPRHELEGLYLTEEAQAIELEGLDLDSSELNRVCANNLGYVFSALADGRIQTTIEAALLTVMRDHYVAGVIYGMSEIEK